MNTIVNDPFNYKITCLYPFQCNMGEIEPYEKDISYPTIYVTKKDAEMLIIKNYELIKSDSLYKLQF